MKQTWADINDLINRGKKKSNAFPLLGAQQEVT